MKRRKFIQQGASGLAVGASMGLPIFNKEEIMKKSDLQTPLCELLGIEYPIIQAGMGDVAGPELVAAVSNAGGLGILTATMVTAKDLRERIQRVRDLTDLPFGVNLLLQKDLFPPADFQISDDLFSKVNHTLNGFRDELGIPRSDIKPSKLPPLIQVAFEIILEEKVPVFSTALGNPPKEMVLQCHDRGIKVMSMICNMEDAVSAEENGVDIIVAQGSEAGGHRSTWEKKESKEHALIGTLPLVSAVVEAVDVPVVAAGGIVNGKGLRAALALGAQGVLMGTRFVVTKESVAPESYKQKIILSSSDDTTVTDVFTGMYARVLRNRFTEAYCESSTPVLPPGRQFGATRDIVVEAGRQERPEFYSLYAGQGIDGIEDVLSAGKVVENIISEAMEH